MIATKTDIRRIELARRVLKKAFGLSDSQSVRLVKDVYKLTSQEIIELYGIYIPENRV